MNDVPSSGDQPIGDEPPGQGGQYEGSPDPSWSHETQPIPPQEPPSPYGAPSTPPPSFTQPYPLYTPNNPNNPGSPYGAPQQPFGTPPQQTPHLTSQRSGDGRGKRAGLIAGVAAAAIIFGGGAGVATSAIYHHDNQDSASAPVLSSTDDNGTVSNTNPNAPQGSVEAVAAKVLPSVVKIEVEGSTEAGSGSGIILSSNGEILTNNHVVAVAGNNGKIRVDFNDGSTASAKILGTDPLTDTAVIKAENVSGLKPATMGQSNKLAVGQSVVAIGSPFGLDSTVTSGIVSALNRPVNVSQDTNNPTVYPAIQTDAAINPGNSGGALCNLAGQVVGINASIRTTSDSSSQESGSIGLGFAIPIDYVLPIVQQMINGQTPTHARMGISVEDVGGNQNEDGLFASNGAQVEAVNAGSAAQSAGIKVGDIITRVNNQLITSSDSLVATIRSYRPGDTVHVTWTRSGKTMSADVKLDSDGGSAKS